MKLKQISLLTRRAMLGAIAGTVALSAFAGQAIADDKITIGALRFTSHSPTFIAYEKGYFKEEGLDVELKFFQAAQPIAVAIASGDIDFGVTALSGGFYSLADKGALKVIGGLMSEKKGAPGNIILASNKAYDAGLKTPADLKGKSWAMTQQGSSFHYMAGLIAENNGFDVSDMKLKPLQKVGSMIGALKSGQVDAMAIVPHIAKALAKGGAAKIIGQIQDMTDYQVTTIFTSTKNTMERKDLVKRFLKAYARGIADYDAVMQNQDKDPAATDAMVNLIHKYVYADRPIEKAAPPIKAGAVYLNAGAALDVKDVEKQLKWFQKHKLAPASLTLDKMVDSSFVSTLN
ncbi:ABC transporter substrate-binding protein [Sneathiella limimaris]|uniref:ABC transporter substrate-binding protein n=1 Tax=Sneathiella limimaris TaxID=1964213 RepID=UPI0019CF8322|nr:ABC transporter substrate-binding protein [Sneathiella limimaris]